MLSGSQTNQRNQIEIKMMGLLCEGRSDLENPTQPSAQNTTLSGQVQPSTQCDCCGRRAAVYRLWAFGLETFACGKCRGWDEDDDQ